MEAAYNSFHTHPELGQEDSNLQGPEARAEHRLANRYDGWDIDFLEQARLYRPLAGALHYGADER
jgi:hypothetical protein